MFYREVDFSDEDGQTYAMLPLHTSQLLKLHYVPDSISLEALTMANTINQYGNGDNIAGDKVMGHKIGTQVNGGNIGNVVNEASDNSRFAHFGTAVQNCYDRIGLTTFNQTLD